jgi:hypothetical protein
MNATQQKDYVIKIYSKLLEKNDSYKGYVLPFATGDYFVRYYNIDSRAPYYEIIIPRKWHISLFPKEDKIKFMKFSEETRWFNPYYNISKPVNLSDYFQCDTYNDTVIPIALNKIGIEAKLKQAINLAAFL